MGDKYVLNPLKLEFVKIFIFDDFIDDFVVAVVLGNQWLSLSVYFSAIICHALSKAGLANMAWVESTDFLLAYCIANIKQFICFLNFTQFET